MKTVLISFCDSSNLGDLLIVEELEKLIKKESAVVTLSFNLNSKNESHKEKLSIVSSLNKKKFVKIYHKYFRKLFFFDLMHYFKHKLDIRKFNWDNFDVNLKDSDLLIIGGGNTIFGATKMMSSTDKILKIIDFAKQKNKKIFLCSIGIGPFKSKYQLRNLDEIINKVDFITVRDEQSFNYVKKKNEECFLSIDPVILLDEFKKTSVISNNIGICIMDVRLNKMSQHDYENYIISMTNMIINLRKSLSKVQFFLYSTDTADYQAVYDVYNNLDTDRVSVRQVTDINGLRQLYSHLDLILGTRMHSLIVGFSQGIPIVGISWQPKVVGFFEMINQSDSVFDIKNLEKKENEIIKLVIDKFNNKERFSEESLVVKNNLKNLYSINSKIIREVLNE